MTIDDLIPDKEINKGGRPPKSEKEKEEEETYGRSVEGRVFTQNSDSEEWWRKTMEECLGRTVITELNTHRDISRLSDFTFLFPVEVRAELDKYDIYETDWKEYLANRPHLFGDGRLPDEWRERTSGIYNSIKDTVEVQNGESEPFYDQIENPNEYKTEGSPTTFKKDVPSDGALSDLINDA